MGGGLLNIISRSTEDIILTGNPETTFFKKKYKKHTNFGMQYFRIDHEHNRKIDYNNDTVYEFTIPRYADLFHDTCLVITLPDIYSEPPFHNNIYCPKFKWIRDLGFNMIKKISISIGGQLITEHSGEYLINLRERDYSRDMRDKINNMTGNIPELYDPASLYNGVYPNAIKNANYEPSIRGRKLYIPLNAWFCHDPAFALPLISLQYQVVKITVELRPFKELFVVSNEVLDEYTDNFLFNEYPAMHNVNFIVKAEHKTDISGVILTNYNDLFNGGDLSNNFKDASDAYIDSTDPLVNALEEYTRSIMARVFNGDSELPYTFQHVGDASTNNVDHVKVTCTRIYDTEYYKVFIYIDRLTFDLSKHPPSTRLDDIRDALKNSANFPNNTTIKENTISIFVSTNENIENNQYRGFIDNVGAPPEGLAVNYHSNNRHVLQQQEKNKNQNTEYAAPDYISILKEEPLLLGGEGTEPEPYTIPELYEDGVINADTFTLNGFDGDVHLMSRYIFLDEPERIAFAKNPQHYLIKVNYEESFINLNEHNSIKVNSKDLVINYMWNFRRSDAHLRNEWSNYTNWKYIDQPNKDLTNESNGITLPYYITPFTGLVSCKKHCTAGEDNKKNILKSLSIIVDGKVRENLHDQGVYNYMEKYLKCDGIGDNGQYFYSFAINNSPFNHQPTGSMNLSKYNDIMFEFSLIEPPYNFVADNVTKTVTLGVPKGRSAPVCIDTVLEKNTKLYVFDMTTHQERYNVLTFTSGMAGLRYAR